MNIIIKSLNKNYYFNLIKKVTFYDSVVINNFDLKNNQNILLTNLNIIKNESLLLSSCLNFLKNFENFSVICCGCNDPKSKVQLKKSIWFSSIGLEMKDFIEYCYKDNEEMKNDKIKIFEEIVKLECPVILKDKNTILTESEIAPKKIVNSSKRMRYFFNISEIHKFSGEPDFSDFTRLMIGFYNICKIYIKRKEDDRIELKHIVEKVNYFHFVLFYIYNYLLKYKHFNYNNVEEGNRNSILKYLKEKRRNMHLVKNQLLQEKVLNIPKEYSNSLIPTNKAKMKKKQKNIFERIQKFRRKSKILEDEEKFMWVEEKDDDLDENNTSLSHDKLYDSKNNNDIDCNENNYNLNNIDSDNSLIEIENKNENYPLFRFQYISKKEEDYESNNIFSYNKMYNNYTKLLEKKVYINLDDHPINEDIIKSENILFRIPEAIGGYTFINYVENIPNNYIFPINENLYKGIQVYKKEEINIDSLWKNIENETLNIKKIGFFNPFNIKKNLDSLQHRKNTNDNSNLGNDYDEITELKDDMMSFQEYIYDKNREKRKQSRRNKNKELDKISYNASNNEKDDNEDERFEYFKKLKNENSNIDDHLELKEQINSIYDNTYNEESNQNYKHTYNIRRKLNDEEKKLETVILDDIKEEKRNLIEDDKKELKEHSFYICKNIKFPELKKDENIKTKNRNKFLNDELQRYIRPQIPKKNSNISDLKSKTIEAHSPSKKG
ncbi:conserved Plasmodium protein, unknown function [Plasmodium relictum]|uniref:Uncharacterized protein n=1 Tax=Plasmodium relictum TaxID=85471 RepID=A0A1J1HBN3_PLARL|nr:conserved Plasmodium protein, unknown function [Plasmodium relictum]CRH02711.1 conserved Plasmodium protein, unknown function [Plasmodium relictum]